MNKYIDHTLLKNNATNSEIEKLCNEAQEYQFMSVCVNPANISIAKKYLDDSDVKICTVVGFPLGASTTETKKFETLDSLAKGADEIDVVINIAKAKENNFTYITNEISEIVNIAENKVVKVILETSELTKYEIKKCCEAAVEANADFVKTSTGFSSGGATIEDVTLMKETVKGEAQVKASGGIRDLTTAQAMIDAGATRLGVSAGLNIMKEFKGEKKNENTNATY
ncbi:MAG: deoxyribose-phosphate aldolase [Bacilli bacterium]